MKNDIQKFEIILGQINLDENMSYIEVSLYLLMSLHRQVQGHLQVQSWPSLCPIYMQDQHLKD